MNHTAARSDKTREQTRVLGGYTHGYTVQNTVPLATWWLHEPAKEKPHYHFDSRVSFVLAERVGFEPTVVLPLRLISSQVHSTTLPPLLCVEAFDYSQIFRA